MSIPEAFLNQPIRLVNTKNNITVVDFPNGLRGRAKFSEDYEDFQMNFQRSGIYIYPSDPKKYHSLEGGKRRVKLDSADFGIAFYNEYFKTKMNPDVFKWVKI